jgi:diguanylate cyclase (GGDEF)-like protein
MKRQPIGFRELLEQVLPVEQLPPLERLRVQRALHGGVAHELEAAALMAMERLEDLGTLARIPSAAPGESQALRYRHRDSSHVITLLRPAVSERDGIVIHPRAALPTRAPADLNQVRRLLHLEDLGLASDPRSARARAVLASHLAQAGQELLGTADVHLYPLAEPGSEAPAPLDPELASEALSRPNLIYYCPDTTRSPRLRRHAGRGIRALAVLAVSGTGPGPLGTLEVRGGDPLPFQAEDLARIALLADYCGGLLERAARLEKLVFVDPMTGVYNRSYFELQARNEMARSLREGSSSALCIVDIDDFKAVNTAYGYEAGNAVLTQVAHALKRGVRPFDTVARWGGEEFVVLLSSPVEAGDVRAACERLRAAVERLEPRVEGLDRRVHDVKVTVSVGVALFPAHGDSPQELWRAANQALLAAKRPPKNRVVFHSDD